MRLSQFRSLLPRLRGARKHHRSHTSGTPRLEVVRSGSSGAPTAIVFSSVNANGFSYYKLFAPFLDRLNCVFVRDPFDAWYTKGIGDGIDSSSALYNYIRQQVEGLNSSRIMTFGSSMGGYAALRMSFAMETDLCLATSPQTLLDTRLPHTPSEPTPSADHDLAPIAESISTSGTILFSGAADFVDQFNVSRVDWAGAKHIPVAGQDHLVAQALHKGGVYTQLIEGFIDGGSADALCTGVDTAVDERCMNADVQALIAKAVNAFYRGARWDLPTLLEELSEFGEWADGCHLMAKHLANVNDHGAAILYAQKAVTLAPLSITLADTLASLYAAAGRLDEAIKAYEHCLTIRPKHYSALCSLAGLLQESDRARSIALLEQAVAIRPRLERAKSMLRGIKERSDA